MFGSLYERFDVEHKEETARRVGKAMCALKMLKKKMSVADVAEYTDLSERDVESLAKAFADYFRTETLRREIVYLMDDDEKIDLYIGLASEIEAKEVEKAVDHRVRSDIARKMLDEGLSVAVTAKCVDLSESQVESISSDK